MSNKSFNLAGNKTDDYKVEPLTLFLYVTVFYLTFLITSVLMLSGKGYDFLTHAAKAVEQVDFSNPLDIFNKRTYPIWHIWVAFLNLFFKDLTYSAAFVTASFNLFTTIIIHKILDRFLSDKYSSNYICIITFMLTFVTPIWLPWFSKHIYLPAGSPTIWHNPTNNAVKGLSLIIFYLFLHIFAEYKEKRLTRMSNSQIILLASLFFLSVLLKPSFMVLFIPSAFIFLLIELITSKGKDFIFCIQTALACVPSTMLVGLQYLYSYSDDGRRGGVVISFFTAVVTKTTNIPLSLMLPFVFPVFVLLLNWRKIYTNKYLLMSIIMSVVGTTLYCCFAEAKNLSINELAWARLLAMMIIWLVTTIEFFKMYADKDYIKSKLMKKLVSAGFVLLFMHFLTGIYYYVYILLLSEGQC